MFIEKADLGQSIYSEILDAISRQDQTFIDSNIGRAIEEVDGVITSYSIHYTKLYEIS